MPETLPLRPAAPDPSDPAAALRERHDAGRPKSLVLSVAPLLLDARRAAAACGMSPASWYRLKAAGKTPAPVRLSGKVLYRVEDLELWVALGCPAQKEFEVRKAAQGNGRR